MIEDTFALIKADAVARMQADAIMFAMGLAGLYLVDGLVIEGSIRPEHQKMLCELYRDHIGAPYYPSLLESVNGRCYAYWLRGWNAITVWRDLLGPTNPWEARRTHPSSIRARFGGTAGIVADNAAHGSDGPDSAVRELCIFFPRIEAKLSETPARA